MKYLCRWTVILILVAAEPVRSGAEDRGVVTWDEIVPRLILADTPGTVFQEVVRPLLDRPACLEAVFEAGKTDEAGAPYQLFRHVRDRWVFLCQTDAVSAPTAPGWRGAVTGLLVELQSLGADEQGRRVYQLKLRRAGTAPLFP